VGFCFNDSFKEKKDYENGEFLFLIDEQLVSHHYF